MSRLHGLRPSPRRAVVATLAAAVVIAGGVAFAAGPAIQTITPHSAKQVTNLDVLRQLLRNYYGDPLGTGVFADDSNYASEARSVAEKASHYLASNAFHGQGTKRSCSTSTTPR